MIVLDEQLLGRNLESAIGKWYPGPVCFVTDLRPNSVIKDDAIPVLLRQQSQPTFITINERDFWQKIVPDGSYCILCFALSDAHAIEIPDMLRALLRYPELRTKTKRMGMVIRVTNQSISYYSVNNRQIQALPTEGLRRI